MALFPNQLWDVKEKKQNDKQNISSFLIWKYKKEDKKIEDSYRIGKTLEGPTFLGIEVQKLKRKKTLENKSKNKSFLRL